MNQWYLHCFRIEKKSTTVYVVCNFIYDFICDYNLISIKTAFGDLFFLFVLRPGFLLSSPGASILELRSRIATTKNTRKITSAMKLVAAAKVRRAQEAVLRSAGLEKRSTRDRFKTHFPLLRQQLSKFRPMLNYCLRNLDKCLCLSNL